MKRIFAVLVLSVACQNVMAVQNEERQWSDTTGRFKVTGTLIEVKDGNVLLQSNGKMMKIPLSRLSKEDQDYLNSQDSPFEVVQPGDAPPSTPATTTTNATQEPPVSEGSAPMWKQAWTINWEDVPTIDRGFGDQKKSLTLPDTPSTEIVAKRAALPKKQNFFEDIRRMAINPIANRAVVGYTVSFSVPKPLSRISLIDIPTGKVINSSSQECDMCPMALMNDGSTVLMFGTGRDAASGTGDQLQLWKITGKNVVRSGIWSPFPQENESFGQKNNGNIQMAFATAKNNLVIMSDQGHLACFELQSRKCLWHQRFQGGTSITMSTDGKLLFTLDGPNVLALDPDSGDVKCLVPFGDKPHVAWPRLAVSPSGKKLLVTFLSELRLLDLTTGEWLMKESFPQNGPIADKWLAFSDEDYALLNKTLLVHLPTMIKVCDYGDAREIDAVSGTSFVAVMGDEGGLLVPTKFPHPKAKEMLEKSKTDPNLFVLKPGVEVSIDVNGVRSENRADAQKFLEKAAANAGYKVNSSASIKIVAAITGPEQEAISFIAQGSYVFNKLTSSIRIVWQNKDIWTTSGSNTPFMVQSNRDESFTDALKRHERNPNMGVFEHAKLPKRLQTPTDDKANPNNTLLTSKFTLQGLVDSK